MRRELRYEFTSHKLPSLTNDLIENKFESILSHDNEFFDTVNQQRLNTIFQVLDFWEIYWKQSVMLRFQKPLHRFFYFSTIIT